MPVEKFTTAKGTVIEFERVGNVTIARKARPAATTVPTREEAKAQAKAEWNANANDCQKQFVSEAVYVAYRRTELLGLVGR